MRIGFVVNDVSTEKSSYTTVMLAIEASRRGHEVWWIGVGDLALDPDDRIRSNATAGIVVKGRTNPERYLSRIQAASAVNERITVEELDVLMLRNDPSVDRQSRPWAQKAGLDFGRLAASRGVIVLNDPQGLAEAGNRMYAQAVPEAIRPRSIVTRDRDDIRVFAKDEGGFFVLKPLLDSEESGVFLVTPEDLPNLNQLVEEVGKNGYIVAQEYVSDESRNIRLFLMNGKPLRIGNQYAAYSRIREEDSSGISMPTTGAIAKAEITDVHLEIAEMIRPKLVEDGVFFTVLDIVGDKLIEAFVFSPSGLNHAQQITKANFSRSIIQSIERKQQHMDDYGRLVDNREMATL